MAREVHCGPDDFRALVLSEQVRGNRVGRWAQPPSDPSMRMRYQLDIEAIEAEFDLPDCIGFFDAADGGNAIGCRLTRCSVGGGPDTGGWLAERARRRWWREQERSPRPRHVFAARDAGEP
jgi:hypothetical protein